MLAGVPTTCWPHPGLRQKTGRPEQARGGVGNGLATSRCPALPAATQLASAMASFDMRGFRSSAVRQHQSRARLFVPDNVPWKRELGLVCSTNSETPPLAYLVLP